MMLLEAEEAASFCLSEALCALSCGGEGLPQPSEPPAKLPDHVPAVLLNSSLLGVSDSQRVAAPLPLYYAAAVSHRRLCPPSICCLFARPRLTVLRRACASPAASDLIYTPAKEA